MTGHVCYIKTKSEVAEHLAIKGHSLALHVKRQPTAPAPANAVDVGGSLAGFGLHTNARHQFVIESQMLECSQVAAGFVARMLRLSAMLVSSMRPMPSIGVPLFLLCLARVGLARGLPVAHAMNHEIAMPVFATL
jgi:hypothetical protein